MDPLDLVSVKYLLVPSDSSPVLLLDKLTLAPPLELLLLFSVCALNPPVDSSFASIILFWPVPISNSSTTNFLRVVVPPSKTDILPLLSAFISELPNFIVSPARYNVLNLYVEEPKSYCSSEVGIIWPPTSPNSVPISDAVWSPVAPASILFNFVLSVSLIILPDPAFVTSLNAVTLCEFVNRVPEIFGMVIVLSSVGSSIDIVVS